MEQESWCKQCLIFCFNLVGIIWWGLDFRLRNLVGIGFGGIYLVGIGPSAPKFGGEIPTKPHQLVGII